MNRMINISYALFRFISLLLLVSCSQSVSDKSLSDYKSELFATEQAFNDMAQEQGVAKAFVFFCADSAVILRGEKLIIGRNSISARYASFPQNGVKLEWKPDFADVAASGDLGYTFGKYTYTSIDSLGNASKSEGIFHTVWKRQKNGEWRFVWD